MNVYLDTSALVKLYLVEAGSERVKEVSENAPTVCTSILAYVEAHSAFARKYRARELSVSQFQETIRSLEADWGSYYIVKLDDLIVRTAASLVGTRALRALDALHLASAKAVKNSTGLEVLFIAADNRLIQAAKAEGLDVVLVEV